MAVGAFVGLVGFSRSFEQQWIKIYSLSCITLRLIVQFFLTPPWINPVTSKLVKIPVVAQAAPAIINAMDMTNQAGKGTTVLLNATAVLNDLPFARMFDRRRKLLEPGDKREWNGQALEGAGPKEQQPLALHLRLRLSFSATRAGS